MFALVFAIEQYQDPIAVQLITFFVTRVLREDFPYCKYPKKKIIEQKESHSSSYATQTTFKLF